MKLKVFLLLSLVANAALLAAYFSRNTLATAFGSSDQAALSSAGGKDAGAAKGTIPDTTGMTPEAKAAAMAAAAGIKPDLWQKLYSKDLPTLIANLRAAGVPAKLIRALVSMELSDLYAEKRKALMGDEADRPFWKTRNPYSGYATTMKQQALYREQSEMLKQLLGPDAMRNPDLETSPYYRRMFGALPAEKAEAIQRMNSDYSELRSQIYSEANGVYLPEDREKMAMLEKERRADLVAMLTPAELEEYDMRNSQTANRLRSQYSTFDFTEQEFRSVYSLMKDFDEKYNPTTPGTFTYTEQMMKDRRAEEEKIKEQVKTMLGEQRYQEYQRASDYVYRTASQLAERLQLPKENAITVYELKKSSEEQARAIYTNRDLNQQARNEALQGIAKTVNAQLDQLLTPKGAEAFKQSGGGSWLRSIDRSSGGTGTRTIISGGGMPIF